MVRPNIIPAALTCAALMLFGLVAARADELTLVMLRHGEKPSLGLGQLNCQGLNRALALPAIIARAFGKPRVIYAPNPAITKMDSGVAYAYIRPLATIEPTAIAFGMSVDLRYGSDDWAALAKHLAAPQEPRGIVLIAWEHSNLVKLARAVMAELGADPAIVPDWKHDDFDGIDVLHIDRHGAPDRVRFQHETEGLNGEPATCPAPAPP